MNNDERKIFWNTLITLEGKDPVADSAKIRSVVQLPKYLYRYRKADTKTLGALQANKMYFSSSNYYDDPFDTFLHIDWDIIQNLTQIISKNGAQRNTVFNQFCDSLSIPDKDRLQAITIMDSINVQSIVPIMTNYLKDIRNEVRKESWSVCFSEDGFNESLWLKYADQHKGFALIYDLTDNSKLLCGKQEKCKECGIFNYGTPLYPVYYSQERYDATNYARYLAMRKLLDQFPKSYEIPSLHPMLGKFVWSHEKVTLIKEKCHEYDREWRMILLCKSKPPVMCEWIPSGIILGLRMDDTTKNVVIALAKEAGIDHIYQSHINNNDGLDIDEIKQ